MSLNGDVSGWEERAKAYGEAYWSGPSPGTLCDLTTDYFDAREALAVRVEASLRPRLWRIVIRLAALAGMIFSDGGRTGPAGEWLDAALEAAEQADDSELECWARAVTSHVAYTTGDYDEVLKQANTAKRLAPSSLSMGAVYAEAASAMAHAARGNSDLAIACLRGCAEKYACLAESVTGLSAFGYPKALYHYHRGHVLTRLNMAALARRSLLAALERCPAGAFAHRVAVRLDLVRCALHDGHDVEASRQLVALITERAHGRDASTTLDQVAGPLYALFAPRGPTAGT